MVRPEGWHRSDNGPIVLLSCRAGDHIAIKVYKGLELIQAEQGEKYGVPWVDLTPTVETHFASTSGKVVIGKREEDRKSVV